MSIATVSTGGALQVREIDVSRRADVGRFIDFPFALYRGVPQWTPPLRLEMREQMDPRKNGFFAHSEAGFFVAERGSHVVGRIAALRHRFYNEKHHNDTAFFHWFESVDDQEVAGALFGAAEAWARARGLRRIIGPVGFIQPDPPGILVRGFEHEATVNVPWHFPYYERLVTEAGFEPHTDYLSGYLERGTPVPPILLEHGAGTLAAAGYRVQEFKHHGEMRPWVERFYHTYLDAFTHVPDFFPMSAREFEALAERMMMIIEPTATKLVLHDDQLIGLLLSFRDLTVGLRRARGNLLPLGWWHLLRNRQTTAQCNIYALGVLPEWQTGAANLALMGELVRTLQASRFERAEIVQIVAGNPHTHGDMSRLGAKWDKCHRVFRKTFPRRRSVVASTE